MVEGLRELIARVQDAVQRLDVHQMEGTFDGQPFLYVLVRRAQVHTILQQELAALAEAGRQERAKTDNRVSGDKAEECDGKRHWHDEANALCRCGKLGIRTMWII